MGLTMCMARPKLICPNCKKKVAVTRPDSAHTYWSFEKPNENDIKTDIIEQNFECNNSDCKNKFKLYWFDEKFFIDRL
jgi:hypothetical protein